MTKCHILDRSIYKADYESYSALKQPSNKTANDENDTNNFNHHDLDDTDDAKYDDHDQSVGFVSAASNKQPKIKGDIH